MEKVSIISVNYNGLKYTRAMINSLQKYETADYEIVIVDNGSDINEAQLLQKEYPEVITIRSEQNLGFAGGNNLGIDHASSDWLLFLNNDTEIRAPFLKQLTDRLNSAPEIGCVSPKIKFEYLPDRIQFAGYTPLTKITLRNRLTGFMEKDDGSFDTPHPTPFAHGAAMMVKRQVIDRAGKMPEDFFLYYEELDWCEKMTKAGFQIWYEPTATVYHKESATTGKESPLKAFYMTRNRLLYAKRNRTGITKYMACMYQCGIVFPRNMLRCCIQRQWNILAANCRGLWKGVTA